MVTILMVFVLGFFSCVDKSIQGNYLTIEKHWKPVAAGMSSFFDKPKYEITVKKQACTFWVICTYSFYEKKMGNVFFRD